MIYDALATLLLVLAVLIPAALALWCTRPTRPPDTRPRRTTIMQGGRRVTLTSEQLPEQ